MMRYILDANIVTRMQDAQGLESLCRAGAAVPMALAEAVYVELTEANAGDHDQLRGKKRAARELLDASKIEVMEIRPDSPAHSVLIELRRGRTSARDKGEAASIALACADPALVFVVADRNATISALNELHGTGERLVRPHVFLRRVVEAGALDRNFVRSFAASRHIDNYGLKPSWWSSWHGAD